MQTTVTPEMREMGAKLNALLQGNGAAKARAETDAGRALYSACQGGKLDVAGFLSWMADRLPRMDKEDVRLAVASACRARAEKLRPALDAYGVGEAKR